jgi:hypothetical protein
VSIGNEWEDRNVSGPFYGFRQQPLVRRTDSTDPPGQYFPPFGDKVTEKLPVFIIDIGNFFSAEFAHSFAPNTETLWTWHSNLAFLHGWIGNSVSDPG